MNCEGTASCRALVESGSENAREKAGAATAATSDHHRLRTRTWPLFHVLVLAKSRAIGTVAVVAEAAMAPQADLTPACNGGPKEGFRPPEERTTTTTKTIKQQQQQQLLLDWTSFRNARRWKKWAFGHCMSASRPLREHRWLLHRSATQ